MIRLTEIIGKPSLKYHIDNSLSLYENVYRYSSDSFIQLFAEARDAYRDGKIQLNEEDLKLIETTDIGLYGVYEGIKVPLDLPMLEESKYDKEETIQQTIDRLKARIADPNDGGNVPFLTQKIKDLEKSLDESFSQKDWDVKWKLPKDNLFNATKTINATNNRYKAIRSLLKAKPTELKAFDDTDNHPAYDMSYDELMKWFKNLKEPVKEAKSIPEYIVTKDDHRKSKFPFHKLRNSEFKIKIAGQGRDQDYMIFWKEGDIGYWEWEAGNMKRQLRSALLAIAKRKLPIKGQLDEAEYKGKDVPLNKPKRGGSKKFYVYTKNKKGNVVKVSFGGTTGLNVKIDEPGARSSFAARHKCATKKDKTKPGYWACNIGRYWKSLGGKRNFSGYW